MFVSQSQWGNNKILLLFVPLRYPPQPTHHLATCHSREKKKRSSDKTETRRLYQILVERAGALWRTLEATRKKCSGSSSGGNLGGSGSNSNSNNNISGGAGGEASTAPALTAITDRPSQAEISALLKDISSIPNLEVAPGGE